MTWYYKGTFSRVRVQFFSFLKWTKSGNQFLPINVFVTNVLFESLISFCKSKVCELVYGVKVRIWEFVFEQKIIGLDWFGSLPKTTNNFKLKLD